MILLGQTEGKLVCIRKKNEFVEELEKVKLEEQYGFKSVTVHSTSMIRMEKEMNTLKAVNEFVRCTLQSVVVIAFVDIPQQCDTAREKEASTACDEALLDPS
jgi:hypothetical protein